MSTFTVSITKCLKSCSAFNKLTSPVLTSSFVLSNPLITAVRNYPAPVKRFYKKTDVIYSDGQYEITLDKRKLKTPRGNPFKLESEPLALAVAAEWDAQKGTILQSYMHLSGLCSTALDNPNNLTKYDHVQQITHLLDTDTILFHSNEPDRLYDLQVQEWEPVIKWFNQRFGVDIRATRDLAGISLSQETKAAIMRHLLSYDHWAIHGFSYGVDTLKSVILTLCCLERYLSVEKAVTLSRLEEEFQVNHWGRVEWAHDLSQHETQARLAAAVLFVHLSSSSSVVRSKQVAP